MSLIVSEIRIPPEEKKEAAFEKALSVLKINRESVLGMSVSKVSVDARHKDRVCFVYSVAVDCENEEAVLKKCAAGNVSQRKIMPEEIPVLKKEPSLRPVIIGFGPGGMFAGLYLARAGAKPIIFERGAEVEKRAAAVQNYWDGGSLDRAANVQFGEGGAGTFSDGKLTTRINDPRCDFILSEFVSHGAPKEILTKAKPHVGTDRLREVVKNIREEIISLGGEVHFLSQIENIAVKDGKAVSVTVGGAEITAENIILAVGHSARDTFEMLKNKGAVLEAKPFSVGMRIEHLREDINRAQYGAFADNPMLGAADYQLSYKTQERCAYTFCMCPGGCVVPAENVPESIVTNGMSRFARDGKNSNSALVCSVSAADFDGDPFKAMAFQGEIEAKAFVLGKGKAPCQTVGSFMNDGTSVFGKVEPSYARGVSEASFAQLYPENIVSVLKEGISAFDRKLRGFGNPEAVLTGPETRTSSPIRILRGENLEAVGIEGLFPCGEGAGYAGGIMSAAADGIRCAEKLLQKLV